MTDGELIGHILDAQEKCRDDLEYLENNGKKIGELYTDYGLPIDISFDQPQVKALPKEYKIILLNSALNHMIQHRKNSNATDSSIEKARKSNREFLANFIKNGEVGVY